MEDIKANTLKGVQEQNCRSHCSFRLLHLLSPFPSTQTHSFQPKTNSSPSWPTSHLHFCGPNQSPMQQPIFFFFPFPFLFFSFPHLSITSSFLLPCCQPFPTATLPPAISPLSHHFPLSSPIQTPITPLAHYFSLFALHVSCMNSPQNTLPTCKLAAKTPCWQPLEDPSFGYKSHQEREEKGWSFWSKQRQEKKV